MADAFSLHAIILPKKVTYLRIAFKLTTGKEKNYADKISITSYRGKEVTVER